MAPPEAAVAHYRRQARQAEAAAILARKQWRKIIGDDLDREWSRIVSLLTLTVGNAMVGAARDGAAYVPDVLNRDSPADGAIAPSRFGQTASDGRPLDSLLFSSIVRVRADLGAGIGLAEALDRGGDWLETLARTQVADAARGSAGVAIAARPHVGYVRLVNPGCCQRCAILAGKTFKWNTGFLRHPKCSCRHVPADDRSSARDLISDITPDQVRDLTVAQRKAIADGADLNQVINAHRVGARSADGMTTAEGTTRRGYASYVKRTIARQRGETVQESVQRTRGTRNVSRTTPRLTPEAIYRFATSREEAVRLLAKSGYIVGDIDRIARSVA